VPKARGIHEVNVYQNWRNSTATLDVNTMNVIRSVLGCLRQSADYAHEVLQGPAPVDGNEGGSPAVARAAAAAAPAPARVSLYALGASSVPIRHYSPEMADDPLGIVAEYLSPTDQLVMRQIGPVVRAVVDAKVRRLTLPVQEACALFSQPGDFSHIRTVELLMCRDGDLIRFAEILRSVRNTDFELSLHGQAGCLVSAVGLRSLAPLSLAGICLQEIQITRDVVTSLSLGTSPVSITLPYWLADQAEPQLIAQIPTLRSLSANKLHLSDTVASSLRSHPQLVELTVGQLSETGFRFIASSATLRALVVQKIWGNEGIALTGMADNQALATLKIGRLRMAESLALLSLNRSLTSVELGVGASALCGIPHLAAMPSLERLSLVTVNGNAALAGEHLEALCARPLKSLSLHCWQMDLAAWTHVTDVHAARLSLDYCYLNNDAFITDIAANARIASLSVYGEMINEGNALVLARSPTLGHLRADFLSDQPNESEARVKTAWLLAGKLLNTLDLSVRQTSPERNGEAWTMPY